MAANPSPKRRTSDTSVSIVSDKNTATITVKNPSGSQTFTVPTEPLVRRP